MTVDSSARESQRVRDLARQYSRKGYSVIVPSALSDVPTFLAGTGYIPDLIATSDRDNLIIEVKTRETAPTLDSLSSVSKVVNAQAGWQFVLVVTNPRRPQPPQSEVSIGRARSFLQKARAIGTNDETHSQASFLFAWVALEAALRKLFDSSLSAKGPKSGWTLIRDAVMAGQLDRRYAQELDRLFKIRNSLLHAGVAPSPRREDVLLLQKMVEEAIREANESGAAEYRDAWSPNEVDLDKVETNLPSSQQAMPDSDDEHETNAPDASMRWTHDVPRVPHSLVNEPLQLLVKFYKEHLQRDAGSGRLTPFKFWISCRGMLAAGEQTYASICILLEDKRAKRLMLQANVLNRSLFELLANVVALTEDRTRFATLARESWKMQALRYQHYVSRFSTVPEWQEYLAVYQQGLSASAAFCEVTPEEQQDPNLIPETWPTPGVMIFGRRQLPPLVSGTRLAALRELYQEHYAGQSAQAHGRGVSMAMALFVESPEAHWNPGQGESNIVSTALLMMACMLSELELAAGYDRHPKLAELWTYLRDMHGEAKELWDLRYQHMTD